MLLEDAGDWARFIACNRVASGIKHIEQIDHSVAGTRMTKGKVRQRHVFDTVHADEPAAAPNRQETLGNQKAIDPLAATDVAPDALDPGRMIDQPLEYLARLDDILARPETP